MKLNSRDAKAASVIKHGISASFFATQFGLDAGRQSLFKVLKAYSLTDLEVGYCQGMAFVAGLLLMYLPEEPAFRMFARSGVQSVWRRRRWSRRLHLHAHAMLHNFTSEQARPPWTITTAWKMPLHILSFATMPVSVGRDMIMRLRGSCVHSADKMRTVIYFDCCRLLGSGPNLRRMYLPALEGLKLQLQAFDFLLARRLPDVHAHLQVISASRRCLTSCWLQQRLHVCQQERARGTA